MQAMSRKIQIKHKEVISKRKLSHYSQNSLLFSSEGHLTMLQAPGIFSCEKLGKNESSPYLEQYALCLLQQMLRSRWETTGLRKKNTKIFLAIYL